VKSFGDEKEFRKALNRKERHRKRAYITREASDALVRCRIIRAYLIFMLDEEKKTDESMEQRVDVKMDV